MKSDYHYIFCFRFHLLILLMGVISGIALLNLNCQYGSPGSKEYNTWSFNGYVIDGSTRKPISDASVIYVDEDGETQITHTDSGGKFFISSLPFGDRSFQFSYTPEDSSEPLYTQRIIVTGTYRESQNVDGVLGDVSQVITLYPLSGAVNGTVNIKLMGSEKNIPVESATIKINFKDSSLENTSPIYFSTQADSIGKFSFTSLPIAPGAILSVNSFTIDNITYSFEPLSITQLFGSNTVPLGTIFLKASDSTLYSVNNVKSNVLSEDGFGLSGISVNKTLWYKIPFPFTPASIDADITGGGDPEVIVSFNLDTIFIHPTKNFDCDSLITVTITGLDTAGNHISLKFDGVKRFRTEKSRYILIRSNVLSSDGFGLTGISADVNPWYILPVGSKLSGVTAAITGGGNPSSTVRLNGDTIFVKPEKKLTYDSLITVSLSGLDSSGNHFEFVFDKEKMFKIGSGYSTIVRSNVLSNDGYGLSGVKVHISPWYQLPLIPDSSSVHISLTGDINPGMRIQVKKDTVFIDPIKNFSYDSLIVITITGVDTAGNRFQFIFDEDRRFHTEIQPYAEVRSNVLSKDGFGLSGVPVSVNPWYVLPLKPVSAGLIVTISGGGSSDATVNLRDDTIYIDPVKNFGYDSLVTIAITGVDTAGNFFKYTFNDDKRFHTEIGIKREIRSNVLSADGYGLTGVSVKVHPWYLLPCTPKLAGLSVTLSGSQSVNVQLSGDTVKIEPKKSFAYNTFVEVEITGVDTAENHFKYTFDGDKAFKTEIKDSVSLMSNVLSEDGFGLMNIPVTVKPWYRLPVYPQSGSFTATISGGGSPKASVRVSGDTVFVEPERKFSGDALITITITGLDTSGNRIEYVFDNNEQFRTEVLPVKRLLSNVLLNDSTGLINVPVTIKPWYRLPVYPEPSTLNVTVSGGGNPAVVVRVKDDTVYVEPVRNFTYDATVAITITGTDTSGDRINIKLDGDLQFRTEKGIFPIASNTWETVGLPRRTFSLNDTFWVKYSEPLNSDPGVIEWVGSSAQCDIYGNGASANANVWIRSDTLFISPDQRLTVVPGQTIGFKTRVLSASGKRSDTIDFVANVKPDSYFIIWTNTKDSQGAMRVDFGTMDSIILVSSAPIQEIRGLSGVSGKTTPSGLSLANVHLSGDTIVYKPSLYFKPDSVYGLDFDILFKDGALRENIFGVSWKTALKISVLSVDNKINGVYKPLHVIGDSITVTFSAPIDTSVDAPVPFKPSIVDVKNKTIRTNVHWNVASTVATIFLLDTLPCADFNASVAYTTGAVNTRAVQSVTFNFTTKAGEQVLNFGIRNETIELHTERGLSVVSSNILLNHNIRDAIDRTETPVVSFPVGDTIRLTFNRSLDTAAMNKTGIQFFAGVKQNTVAVSSTVWFSADAKTILIKPATDLIVDSDYYVWIKNVPGAGIANAPAINKDAGTYSGKSAVYNLLDKPFRAQ